MRSKFGIILEALCLIILIAVTIYVGISWITLPNRIPIHFNAAGQVDGYGSKITLLFILPVMYIFYGLLSFGQKYPQANNYLVTITAENQERQYNLVKNLLRVIKFELMLIYAYLQYAMVQSAFRSFSLGGWFLPVTLIMIFGALGLYLFKSVKAK